MNSTLLHSALSLTLLAALSSCGGTEHGKHASMKHTGQVIDMSELSALRSAVFFDSGDAALALVDNDWLALRDSMQGVRELKAGPRGSVVRLGDATLWMRSGSHLRLGQSKEGKMIVELKAGQARMRGAQDAMLVVDGKTQTILNSDVLMSHQASTTMMFETRLRPRSGAWSLELESEAEARGIGSLEVGQGDNAAPLQLRKMSVSVTIAGGMAITEVEHVFYNPSTEQREGTFRFPAPDGVMVTGMAMEINGRMMEGEFVERIKARQVYESIVDEMQDPALLEWQQGGWFKLRVFPIEGESEKRVVLRYAAPLQKSLEGYEYRYLATPPEKSEVGKFTLSVNGQVAAEYTDLSQARDIVLPFSESTVPALATEDIGEFSYTALTVRPSWNRSAEAATPASARQVILAVDSSRSALESRELSTAVVTMVLNELSPQDKFAFFAHDIDVRSQGKGFVSATPDNIASALKFYSELELDGASDLDATLKHAANLAKGAADVQVIYVGDGTPSWGETQEEKLVQSAKKLGDASLFAAILGRGASLALWQNLTGGEGGTVVRPHTAIEARKLAFFLANAPTLARKSGVSFADIESVDIFPSGQRTLFEGEELRVLVRAPKGKMPASLTMNSVVSGKSKKEQISLSPAIAGTMVAKRFASAQIAKLTRDGADKDIIVAMSREFGVMSKHTSLLVLESEEAYQQHQIERKKKEALKLAANAQAPQVTGGDLDNLDGRQASLSPDHIQPGDPEVRIPAPADARSVVLVFPFGETKIAHYDETSRTWIARFLISPETPDGEYWVQVRIEHADGRLEDLRLPYT
ncbi:MAG: hypothetical protein JKY56_08225, partial [Kofleriaceae bacterium]|nr:hypothetical protein [Kofleriaceae bacterium]